MEEKRTLGYLCPKCGKAVMGERTAFALSAAAAAVVCDCGESELLSETDGSRFCLTVPCGICGGEHIAEVSREAMFRGKGIALSCPDTKELCCYIGEDSAVRSAIGELALTAEKRRSGEEAFVDNVIMYEVLSELRDIAARGGISCACGAEGCAVEVHGAAVDLVCRRCGGKLRVPAATDEDLDRLCCQYTLTIPGK